MFSTTLEIRPLTTSAKELYAGVGGVPNQENAGFDVFVDKEVVIPAGGVGFIETGISARATMNGCLHLEGCNVSFFLMPRSSIYKTPLLMANSVGLIDSGYTGPIKAAVRNVSSEDYCVERGVRLFQLVPISSGRPFSLVNVVDSLPTTSRGSGGFGSTGS